MSTPWEYCAETHYTPIDEDHLKVVRHIEALINLIDHKQFAELNAGMEALVDLVVAHFAHEERLMEKCRYDKTAEHKEAHASFVKDMKNFSEELRVNGLTESFRLWAGGRLGNWFRLHIKTHDIALAKAVMQAERSNG